MPAAVSGRSISADLVDCTAPLQAWQKQTAPQIAHALCEPYGIKVADEADLSEVDLSEVFDDFASQPGETVAKALVRLARAQWHGKKRAAQLQGGLGLRQAHHRRGYCTRNAQHPNPKPSPTLNPPIKHGLGH